MDGYLIKAVSLDTQVFVTAGFCLNSKTFQSLIGHFASGRLHLLMSDITVREVRARIKKAVAAEALLQRQFCNQVNVLHNSSLPAVKAGILKFDEEAIADDLCAQFDHFLAQCHAKILDSGSLSADVVLDKYFAGEPPFGNKEEKKFEFPDALAIQALSEWAEDHEEHMLVISDDKLFREACKSAPGLYPKRTLGELLDQVASDDQAPAQFLRSQTLAHLDTIEKQATEQFEQLDFWVEDEEGEAQVEVTDIRLQGEPEILQIDGEDAVIQLTFEASYKAKLHYVDSATVVYSEGDLVYSEDCNEEVARNHTLQLEVNVTFDHHGLEDFSVDDVLLTGPTDGFGIETARNHGWPWK